MGPGFAILHHQIGLCLADKTVNEKGSRPLYFPLTARTPRPWTTGTGSAMPIGGPRTARSWPTKARGPFGLVELLQGLPDPGRVLGRPHHEQRHLFSHLRSKNHRLQERYEANIYDQRPDPEYGTGLPQCGQGISDAQSKRQWNNYEITAKGSHLTIVFNGSKTVDIQHAQFTEGPISLQFANREKGTPGGAIKWRKVQIRPL